MIKFADYKAFTCVCVCVVHLSQDARHVWFIHLEIISMPQALAHRGLIWWKAVRRGGSKIEWYRHRSKERQGGNEEWERETGRQKEGQKERDPRERRGRSWKAPRPPLISGMERKRNWLCECVCIHTTEEGKRTLNTPPLSLSAQLRYRRDQSMWGQFTECRISITNIQFIYLAIIVGLNGILVTSKSSMKPADQIWRLKSTYSLNLRSAWKLSTSTSQFFLVR